MGHYKKDPDSKLDYSIDWSQWLESDTIATSTWTVQAGLTQAVSPAPSNTTTKATVWLQGGAVGQIYAATNRITTAAGRIEERTLYIEVVER